MERKLYQHLASLMQSIRNCEKSGNVEWRLRHTRAALALVDEHMPSGGGLDTGTALDLDWTLDSKSERLIFSTSFHHMNETGSYDGWTQHVVIVKPSFDGIDIRIIGRDRNDIKEYLHDLFMQALQANPRLGVSGAE